MFKKSLSGRYAAALLALAASASPAAALTGEDVMTKMTAQERFTYVAASISMAAYMTQLQGDGAKASCVMDWFFGEESRMPEVEQVLTHFEDRTVQPVMLVLINRNCGD